MPKLTDYLSVIVGCHIGKIRPHYSPLVKDASELPHPQAHSTTTSIMAAEIKEIKTSPFDGQKPGTSGLRKR